MKAAKPATIRPSTRKAGTLYEMTCSASGTISRIVRDLESLGENEVTTETIGESVMAQLRELDDVAYVRFASVYRNFREAKDFRAALDELSGEEDGRPAASARK